MENIFEKLSSVNVSDHTEKKKNLTYLSWAWAWGELKKKYPTATYKVWKDNNNMPFVYDEALGYMVFTEITVEGLTHEMWLFVMDGANKAMKNKEYFYTTKYGEKQVNACTMFDINKTIMRCLVKNIGMFGLGLYIYAGEDLPENEDKGTGGTTTKKPKVTSKAEKEVTKPANDTEEDIETLRGQAMGFHHALINSRTLNFGEASRLSNKHLGVTKPEEATDLAKLKMYIEDCKELLKAK